MARFEATAAKEARASKVLPLIIGLISPSSGGKTYTALTMARGIQSVVGGKIFVIDTEDGRALHYADDFDFEHVPFSAPYGSLDYLEALRYAKAQGAGVVIVDQVSYEHDGPGGLLEQHEAALERMAGSDYKKRERMTFAAWIKPKANRKKLLNAIVSELDMPVIFCWRAKQVTKPVRGGEPIDMGYSSVGAEEWKFECTVNIMFAPNAAGVPMLESPKPGEAACIKVPKQFAWLYDHKGSVDEDVGRRMALWAKGGTRKQKVDPSEWLETTYLAGLADADSAKSVDAFAEKHAAALARLEKAHPELSARAAKALADRKAEFAGSSSPFDIDN
jgi:hypothetical protein